MGFFLAVMAALCNAIASVLQRRGASTAPDTSVLRVKLMTFVLRRPVWVIGFLVLTWPTPPWELFQVTTMALMLVASVVSRAPVGELRPRQGGRRLALWERFSRPYAVRNLRRTV